MFEATEAVFEAPFGAIGEACFEARFEAHFGPTCGPTCEMRGGGRSSLQMPAIGEGAIVESPEPGLDFPRTAPPRLVLGSRLLSIRVPPKSAFVDCELCAHSFSAQGPTGYYDEQPICDRCLLEHESQLGMLLALSIFTRTYAGLAEKEGENASDAAIEMLAFARIYELFAARFGPSRPLDFNAFSAAGTIS